MIKFEIYKSNWKPKFEKSKELAGYMFVNLVIHDYIKQKISLYYSLSNAQTLSISIFIMKFEAEAKVRIMIDSWYY